MDIQLKKMKLMEMLLKVNSESLINKMEQLLEKELTVGYTTTGKPLTIKQYNKRLFEAEKQVAMGKITSQEDLENESKTW